MTKPIKPQPLFNQCLNFFSRNQHLIQKNKISQEISDEISVAKIVSLIRQDPSFNRKRLQTNTHLIQEESFNEDNKNYNFSIHSAEPVDEPPTARASIAHYPVFTYKLEISKFGSFWLFDKDNHEIPLNQTNDILQNVLSRTTINDINALFPTKLFPPTKQEIDALQFMS